MLRTRWTMLVLVGFLSLTLVETYGGEKKPKA